MSFLQCKELAPGLSKNTEKKNDSVEKRKAAPHANIVTTSHVFYRKFIGHYDKKIYIQICFGVKLYDVVAF